MKLNVASEAMRRLVRPHSFNFFGYEGTCSLEKDGALSLTYAGRFTALHIAKQSQI
jgi:hypothetical protein